MYRSQRTTGTAAAQPRLRGTAPRLQDPRRRVAHLLLDEGERPGCVAPAGLREAQRLTDQPELPMRRTLVALASAAAAQDPRRLELRAQKHLRRNTESPVSTPREHAA
ncbi:hypothetical protein EYF80_068396 [Liparis tanakae]|uniref:Uncharacterized protein n=1 Tax=Liparis tanakae TaxID=230148 RepID=A0A4Z2DY88_9TELE|nr:hypothetical protein EYF80_068396 [Liparis tanakae]